MSGGNHSKAHTALVRSCLQFLALQPCKAWPSATSGIMRTGKDGRQFRTPSGQAGCPDITVVWQGRYIGIEVKTGAGKQTPAQVDWQREVEANGGRYWIVRDIEDLMSAWRDIGGKS